MIRHLLQLTDLTAVELRGLLSRAATLKEIIRLGAQHQPLRGRTLAMVFEKASTRTRVSFDVGMHQLGGRALNMRKDDLQLGRGESLLDTAKVLSRYVDGIMVRTYEHSKIEMFAAHADVPVINGLTDMTHPCQVLADLLTCREAFGSAALSTMRVAYVGDGNNMAHSWINAAKMLGFELAIACPEGYDPDPAFLSGVPNVSIERDPHDAADGADVVTTDMWASMGQEDEARARVAAFAGYCVDAPLMSRAAGRAIFLHCLPAHRGEEVSAEVIDGPQSRIYDEAENRLHAQKAVLEWLLGGPQGRSSAEE